MEKLSVHNVRQRENYRLCYFRTASQQALVIGNFQDTTSVEHLVATYFQVDLCRQNNTKLLY
jgi:hypothetical protein